MFDEERLREYEMENQFEISISFNYLALTYPKVTWLEAQYAYEDSVRECLEENSIKCIIDLPYGQGFGIVREKFKEKLKELNSRGL